MSNADNMSGFGLGLLAGAAVGLAVGFLYAPRAGAEMRTMIREKSDEAWNKADDIIKEAEARAKKIIEDARGTATQIGQAQGKGAQTTE
jgi:gas vesicle protein